MQCGVNESPPPIECPVSSSTAPQHVPSTAPVQQASGVPDPVQMTLCGTISRKRRLPLTIPTTGTTTMSEPATGSGSQTAKITLEIVCATSESGQPFAGYAPSVIVAVNAVHRDAEPVPTLTVASGSVVVV